VFDTRLFTLLGLLLLSKVLTFYYTIRLKSLVASGIGGCCTELNQDHVLYVCEVLLKSFGLKAMDTNTTDSKAW